MYFPTSEKTDLLAKSVNISQLIIPWLDSLRNAKASKITTDLTMLSQKREVNDQKINIGVKCAQYDDFPAGADSLGWNYCYKLIVTQIRCYVG